MARNTSYDDIKESCRAWDHARKLIAEGEERQDDGNSAEAVPYTQQDEILQTSIETCRTQFGAKFSMTDKPMQYYPQDNDVILSGIVPDMNNLKFQYRLNDPQNGCYVWCESMSLNDEYLRKLNVIYGVYKNWRQQLSTSEDIAPLTMKNKQK